MTIIHEISRRQFIATSLTAAGGFVLGIGAGADQLGPGRSGL